MIIKYPQCRYDFRLMTLSPDIVLSKGIEPLLYPYQGYVIAIILTQLVLRALERIRTFDLQFRKLLLYPLSYKGVGGTGPEEPVPPLYTRFTRLSTTS